MIYETALIYGIYLYSEQGVATYRHLKEFLAWIISKISYLLQMIFAA
jgi:hypothetical protein